VCVGVVVLYITYICMSVVQLSSGDTAAANSSIGVVKCITYMCVCLCVCVVVVTVCITYIYVTVVQLWNGNTAAANSSIRVVMCNMCVCNRECSTVLLYYIHMYNCIYMQFAEAVSPIENSTIYIYIYILFCIIYICIIVYMCIYICIYSAIINKRYSFCKLLHRCRNV